MPNVFAQQEPMRHPLQLAVNERRQPIPRRRIAIIPIQKQLRHLPARQFLSLFASLFGKRLLHVFGSMGVHRGISLSVC